MGTWTVTRTRTDRTALWLYDNDRQPYWIGTVRSKVRLISQYEVRDGTEWVSMGRSTVRLPVANLDLTASAGVRFGSKAATYG